MSYFHQTECPLRHSQAYKLKNRLLASVGLFELANAGDFAANYGTEFLCHILQWY
jgi:hypothetical protein